MKFTPIFVALMTFLGLLLQAWAIYLVAPINNRTWDALWFWVIALVIADAISLWVYVSVKDRML